MMVSQAEHYGIVPYSAEIKVQFSHHFKTVNIFEQGLFCITFYVIDDLQFYVFSNNISVISGSWAEDNERVCAMEPYLQLRRFPLEQGMIPGLLDQ